MEMVLNIVLLLVGFVLLIKGADFFVDGSSSVAKIIGVPGFVIGLTVVAMGTSAPEAAVSITAGFQGSNEIAISNVVGSNIFNLLVVAGLCAVLKPYSIEKTMLRRDFPVNIIVNAILLVMIYMGKAMGLVDGILMLVLFAAYIAWVVLTAFKDKEAQAEADEVKKMSPVRSILYILGGLGAVILGGQLVVNNAQDIALAFGLSETFIGLTIIAIGTSLPELVTSVVAAKKGESGLALGNVIGSNIFNIMLILGLSSSLNPIATDMSSIINVVILLAVTSLIFVACLIKKGMGRVVGGISVLGYVAYTVYLVMTSATV